MFLILAFCFCTRRQFYSKSFTNLTNVDTNVFLWKKIMSSFCGTTSRWISAAGAGVVISRYLSKSFFFYLNWIFLFYFVFNSSSSWEKVWVLCRGLYVRLPSGGQLLSHFGSCGIQCYLLACLHNYYMTILIS